MEKLKDLKGKHDHLLTKLLKVFLFSCVMIAPIIAGTSQMLYATFNKNAKDSYSDTSVNTTEITSYTSLQVGLKYEVSYVSKPSPQQDITIYYSDISIIPSDYGVPNMSYDSFAILENNKIRFYTVGTHDYYDSTNAVWGDTLNSFLFTYSSYANQTRFGQGNTIWYLITYGETYLDNAFYYGMDKMANSNMFSWTKNTGIYTGINAMTTGMDINTDNNILAVLLTYWLLMTAIYIVIDIIIELFVKLTHLLS